MSTRAEVRSLAQLQNLRERCANNRAQMLQKIDALRSELQKLTRWLDDEASVYWQREMVLAERKWNECREALVRCQATVRADEQRPCTEERKQLERATQRRTLCDQRLRALREARLVWQKQVIKVSGRMQHAADMADAQLLSTVHQLDAIISTLASYARLSSSGGTPAQDSLSTPQTAGQQIDGPQIDGPQVDAQQSDGAQARPQSDDGPPAASR